MTQLSKYFSQLGEDALLDHFFGFKTTGYFVDVGAFDGVHLSNSYIFEQRGWTGICVEAAPAYFDLCVKNRPRSRCVHAACVGAERGMIEFQFERGGLFSGITTNVPYVEQTFAQTKVPFSGFETIKVPSVTLNGLLGASPPQIDFVSIDVEGTEVDVLAGLDLERLKPRVLVLEANTVPERQALDACLNPRGYGRARSLRWNHFYVRTREDARSLRAISVSATLERVQHPLGALHTRFGYPLGTTVNWPAET